MAALWRAALLARTRCCSAYLLAIAVLMGGLSTAAAQPPIPVPPAAPCPADLGLPAVPLKAPRPMVGDGQQFQIDRAGAERAPVASFVQSLQSNDAAIEVIVGQGRLLTLKADLAGPKGTGVVAVGDPTIVEFELLPNPRLLRLVGKRAGVTDLSVITADGQTLSFEVRVMYDLKLLRAQLQQAYTDAYLQLGQLREHMIVEGEARSPAQVAHIIKTLELYLESVQTPQQIRGARVEEPSATPPQPPAPLPPDGVATEGEPADQQPVMRAAPGVGGPAQVRGAFVKPRLINLIRVPGVHQVLLQVQVAELNRTAFRQIGADLLVVDPSSGNIFGTNIAGNSISALGMLGLGGLAGSATGATNPGTTAFGIFPSGDFELLIRALRRNAVLSILAEPNLTTLSGHRASFLAGGQFPVPVPQTGGGLTNTITIEFKDFGVQVDFVPFVMEDGQIRLQVTSEVSSIDFALGTTLVPGGDPVPGLNSRRTNNTIELGQGQTLAIAGLLQVELSGQTDRIPGLGDLPYIGALFSNNTHRRVEKELLIMVTPYLVSPMNPNQVPCLPTDSVKDPTDLEFFLLQRIEGRTGRDVPSTKTWDDPLHLVPHMNLERRCVSGPVGFSE